MDKTIHECYTGYMTLRNEMGRWLKQSMLLDPPGPNDGGEAAHTLQTQGMPWLLKTRHTL